MKTKNLKETNFTTISVSKEIVKQLKEVGKKSETYDAVIKRLIQVYNVAQKITV